MNDTQHTNNSAPQTANTSSADSRKDRLSNKTITAFAVMTGVATAGISFLTTGTADPIAIASATLGAAIAIDSTTRIQCWIERSKERAANRTKQLSKSMVHANQQEQSNTTQNSNVPAPKSPYKFLNSGTIATLSLLGGIAAGSYAAAIGESDPENLAEYIGKGAAATFVAIETAYNILPNAVRWVKNKFASKKSNTNIQQQVLSNEERIAKARETLNEKNPQPQQTAAAPAVNNNITQKIVADRVKNSL